MSLTNNERQSIAVLVLLAIVGTFYIHGFYQEIAKTEKLEAEISAYAESLKPFLNLALNAKAFAIFDVEKNQFVYKNGAEKTMPLASLAKVMSAIIVLENVPSDHIFRIEKESLSQTGDNGLLLAEKWGRDELLKFALVTSSNDAFHQMAIETGRIIDPETTDPVVTFVSFMNDRAKTLGLHSAVFYNESGLDLTPEQNGAYANARDMARLFAYATENYPDVFSATTQKTFSVSSFDKNHEALNTNPIVEEISGVLASKTGFTNISGGNLIVAVLGQNNTPIIIVVMGSTFDDRFMDVKAISGALSMVKNNNLLQ